MIDVKQFRPDKILRHINRVNKWLKGENPAPINFELDLTNVCNHKCKECVCDYFQSGDKSYLTQEQAENYITQLAKAGAKSVVFTGGGEPLCHKDVIDIVYHAEIYNLDIGFITNGELLTDDISDALVNSCKWIRISLDAATPEVYEKTHGRGSEVFNKVLDNIKRLVKFKSSSCTVGIAFLTTKYSQHEMSSASKIGKELGVDYIQYRPMQLHVDGKFEYDKTDISDVIDICRAYSTDNYEVLFSKHKYDMMKEKNWGRDYDVCHGQQFATVIAADAKMYICCHLRGHGKYCIGDLSKNSFQHIWNSDRRKQVVDSIDFKDCIPLCRCNTFNRYLWKIKQPIKHENFL